MDCWGKNTERQTSVVYKDLGEEKPFKEEAWGDKESKKESWINIDSAENIQAHLYLAKQVEVIDHLFHWINREEFYVHNILHGKNRKLLRENY